MDQQSPHQKISAIVAAHNEATRIGDVLSILTTYSKFSEVIVIDDGSNDNTHEVATSYGARVLRHEYNRGKAQAMETGVRTSQSDIFFFADADITGLTHGIIDEIVQPVMCGETEMFIGMRNRKIFVLRWILPFVPLLGGERCVTRVLWERIPVFYKKRFRVEVALNFFALYYGKGLRTKVFPNIRQTIKERKYGLRKGLQRRMRMNWDVVLATLRLHHMDIPITVANRRRLFSRLFLHLVLSLTGIVALKIVKNIIFFLNQKIFFFISDISFLARFMRFFFQSDIVYAILLCIILGNIFVVFITLHLILHLAKQPLRHKKEITE